MNNLIKANFMRLSKDKIFCLILIFALALGVYSITIPIYSIENLPDTHIFEDNYFFFAPITSALIAIFASMFFGTEHSDGALKNKIIVGLKRNVIYSANLITSFIVSLIYTVLFLLVGLIGLVPLGGFTLDFYDVMAYILIIVVSNFVFCALFVLVAMLCPNKTLILLVSLTILVFMFIVTSQIDNALKEPEIEQGMVTIINGEFDFDTQAKENPRYISGTAREVYEMILLFSPVGQVMKVTWIEVASISQVIVMIGFSAINIFILFLIGILCFNKKDYK